MFLQSVLVTLVKLSLSGERPLVLLDHYFAEFTL